MNILIVVDNEDDAFFLSELIESNHPEEKSIFHKSTLLEASKALNCDKFDIVLIDLTLPDSFGIFNYLKLFQENADTPFIVLTGINDEYVGINAVKNGAQDFLVKGNFDELLLNRSIQYSIERKKTEVTLRRSERCYIYDQ